MSEIRRAIVETAIVAAVMTIIGVTTWRQAGFVIFGAVSVWFNVRWNKAKRPAISG